MLPLVVERVHGVRARRAFAVFPWRVYHDDPIWVPPVLGWRLADIDPRRGSWFRRGGEAELFVARRGRSIVGTICAASEPERLSPPGREAIFGFFEYLPDREAFDALLAEARRWATDRGARCLVGPINLDYENGYGVLVEGRERPPAILCGHTPSWYLDFMESSGALHERPENIAYELDLATPNAVVDRTSRAARRALSATGLVIRTPDFTKLDSEVDSLYGLLNRALAHLPDFKPWVYGDFRDTILAFRRFADPELILLGEIGGRLVSWFPGLPDMNEALAKADGLRGPAGMMRYLLASRRRPSRLCLKSVLVQPEYWAKGVALAMFDELVRRAKAKGYRSLDLSLTSTDNPYTPALAERLGARLYKRYQLYRFNLESC
jgi:GNAT superfamily N-acetyltransferase